MKHLIIYKLICFDGNGSGVKFEGNY